MSALDLSKSEKRIARQIIEEGLAREFEKGVSTISRIIQKWQDDKSHSREIYYELFKEIMRFDRHIGRRYDNMKGSTYIYIMAGQLADRIISTDELASLNPETRNKIIFLAEG